jgi:hypothetical protein
MTGFEHVPGIAVEADGVHVRQLRRHRRLP